MQVLREDDLVHRMRWDNGGEATLREGPPQGRLRGDPHPLMLIGRFNKMLEYTRGCFFELYVLLRRRLPDADNLIISGYSFSDKGINTALIGWVYSAPGPKRLHVIHPRPAKLQKEARPAISTKWRQWEEEGVLRVISKGFEEVSLTELGL